MAAAAYFDQIQKIYIAFYQRPADPAGLRYWAGKVNDARGDLSPLINAFATSIEAVKLYGTIDASTIGAVIDSLYLALYDRAPDAAGRKFFMDGFTAGIFTPASIALAVLAGARSSDAVAIEHKLQVANEFTQQVDGRPLSDPEFGDSKGVNASYAGSGAEAAARAILAGVTSDPATVLTPAQVTSTLQADIAQPGDPILDGNTGGGGGNTGGGGGDTGGGGGGGPAPAPTFTATVVDGVVTFSGTATGDIDVSISGDGTASFVRGGITASTTVATVASKTIQLASGQTLAINSADATALAGVHFTGAGAVQGTEAFSVAQFSALEFDNTWTGTKTYSLTDSLAELQAASGGIVSGASSYTLTDATLADLTDAQILLVKGASNAASYDTAPPTFTSVSVDSAKIILTFSENIAVGTGNIVIKKVADNSIAATIAVGDAQVSFNGTNGITIQPTTPLDEGTVYYIEIDVGAIKDAFGNPFAGISDAATTSNFTAVAPPLTFEVNVDTSVTPPTISFSGTATGFITFTLEGTVATFKRGNLTATTTVDFSTTPAKTIALALNQVLIANGADISGKAVSGNGVVAVLGPEATTDLSQLASTLRVQAAITSTTDLSTNTSLAGVKQYFVFQDDPQEVVTLTLTAAQASGTSIQGYGKVTITGSDGAQTLDIQTYNTSSVTSTTHITAGQGGDAIALGGGKDTVYIAGDREGATESAAVTFQAMEAGDSITVAGKTFTAIESISAENVAVQFASLGTNQLTGFTSGAAQGAAVTFTSTTPNDNVTNIGLTSSSAKTSHTPTVVTTEGASAASFVTVETAQGVPGPAGTSVVVHQGAALPESSGFSRGDGTTTSKRFLSAKELFSGQSVSIAGLTLTATENMTAKEVAAAFKNLPAGSTGDNALGKGGWSGTLAGYQILANTSGSEITVATLAPSSELIDINNLGLQATGPTENSVVTFGAMSAGQVLKVGGLTLSATGAIAAADVATAFANLSAGDSGGAGISGTWEGALSAFTSAAAVGDTVTFTSTTPNGNVTDLPVLSGRTETTTVTFKDLAAGQSITVGGLTLTTTNNIEAWQVADEFNDLVAGTTAQEKNMMSWPGRTWSGTLTGFTSRNEGDGGGYGPSSTTVTFTSTTPGQNVADLVVTATGPGTESTVGSTETASVTFQALTKGDSITVAGLTLTATDNVSADDVAAGFAGLQAGDSSGNTVANAAWSGTALTGFNAGAAAGAVVVFTSTTPDKNVDNIAISSARDTSAFAPAVVTTDGQPSGPSDSYALNGDYSTMDTIENFSFADDALTLPSQDIWAPSGTVGTGTVTISGGMATFDYPLYGLTTNIDVLLTALGTNTAAVAFVNNGNTYVLYGDGVAGTQSSDIVVCLTGVQATSLNITAGGNALVLA